MDCFILRSAMMTCKWTYRVWCTVQYSSEWEAPSGVNPSGSAPPRPLEVVLVSTRIPPEDHFTFPNSLDLRPVCLRFLPSLFAHIKVKLFQINFQ